MVGANCFDLPIGGSSMVLLQLGFLLCSQCDDGWDTEQLLLPTGMVGDEDVVVAVVVS